MVHATSLRTSRALWLLTIGGFYTFLVFGFIDNLKGPTWPALLSDLSFSYTQGGTILFGAYLGFLLATLVTGLLADTLGNKLVLVLAGIFLMIGIAVFSYVSEFWALFGAMVIVGLGTGSIEVGGNALIVELHSERRGQYLNLLGVFHGVGALIAPLYVAQLLQLSFTWRQIHRFSILLALLLAVYFVVIKYPRQQRSGTGSFDFQVLRRKGFSGPMRWYYLLIALYVAAELGTAAWVVEFLQQVKGFTVARSSLYLSLFFGFVMAGRLVGSVIVDRMGYLRTMLLFSIAAIICLGIGIFGPISVTIMLPITGFFFSIIFPTVTAAVSILHRENTGTILGMLFAFGGVGGAVGPWAIGVVSDWGGIAMGLSLVIVYCLVVIVALINLRDAS